MKKTKPGTKSMENERGNVFFALFGAVAVVGVIGAASMSIMRGPLTTMVEVNKRTQAESQMQLAGRMAIVQSSSQASAGDCDSDGFIEPLLPNTFGTTPSGTLTNGGALPNTIGATKTDPWGTEYGYCAWDAGSVTNGGGTCSTSLVEGSGLGGTGVDADDYPIITIVSAGPDRVFSTNCQTHAAAAGGALAIKGSGDDDIIISFTYGEAQAFAGGLWKIQSGDPTVAEIDKNLDVTGGATFSGTSSLDLSGLSGSLLLPDDIASGACIAANDGVVRRNTTTNPHTIEICDFTNGAGWVSVAAGATSLSQLTDDDTAIVLDDGAPQIRLDVDGTQVATINATDLDAGSLDLTTTGTLNAGNTTVGTLDASDTDITGTLDVTGNGNVNGNLGVGNPATVDVALEVNGDADISGDVESATVTTGSVDITDGGTIDWGTGTVNITGSSAADTLDITAANTTFSANVSITGDLDVDGVTTLDVTTIDDALTVNANSDLNGTLDVSGTVTLTGTGTALDVTNNAAIGGNLDVDGQVEANQYIISSAPNTNQDLADIPDCDGANDKLTWDTSSGWGCGTDGAGAGGGSADDLSDNSIDDLNDVDTTGAADGNILVYDGTTDNRWESIGVSGDATLNGAGALTIADDAVTFAKVQDVSSNILLGRGTAGAGNIEEITLGTGLALTGTVLNVSSATTSLIYDADTDTLVQVEESADEDVIRFDTAGTERAIIDAAGSMGLGDFSTVADTVDDQLHLVGGRLRIDGPAANGAGCIQYDDATDTLQFAHDCTNFFDFVSGSTAGGNDTEVQFNNAGALDGDPGFTYNAANDSITVDGSVIITGQAGAAPTSNIPDVLNDLSDTDVASPSNGECLIYSSGSGNWESGSCSSGTTDIIDADNDTGIDVDTANDGSANTIVFSNNGSESMRLDNAGNLGIQTNTPIASLHVVSAGVSEGTPANSSGEVIRAQRNNASNSAASIGIVSGSAGISSVLFGDAGAAGSGRIRYDNSDDSMNFMTAGSERVRIDSAGNIGVGTPTPNNMITLLGGDLAIREDDDGNTAVELGAGNQTGFITLFNDGTLNTVIRSAVGSETYFNAGPVVFGNTTADGSARVQIDSTSQGFLLPRVADPLNDIATPATGLIAYDSTDNQLQVYDGSNWVTFSGGPSTPVAIDDLTDGVKNLTENNFFLGHEGGANIGVNNLDNTGVGIGALDALDNATSTTNWGDGNTALGYNALTANTRGFANTAIGRNTLENITDGHSNTAIGWEALSGGSFIRNTAVGSQALSTLNGGDSQNTALGGVTGLGLRNGDNNVIIGYEAARAHTTAGQDYDGSDNIFIGYRAAYGLDATNDQNTIIGTNTAASLTGGGSGNILLGYGVDVSSSTSSNELNIGNVLYGDLANGRIGIGALPTASTLHLPTAGDALRINASGNPAVPLIFDNMDTANRGAEIRWERSGGTNVATIRGHRGDSATPDQIRMNPRLYIGASTASYIERSAVLEANSTIGGFLPPRMTTTQRDNIDASASVTLATGLIIYNTSVNALQVYDGSNWVTFSGGGSVAVAINDLTDALNDPTTDFDGDASDNDDNLFIGHLAASLTGDANPGARNTAVGVTAGDALTEADNNTLVGFEAGGSLTTGADNTFIGQRAGDDIVTGRQNTFVGSGAGSVTSAGAQFNTAVGHNAGRDLSGVSNAMLGASAGVNASGNANTLLGASSGFRITSGDNNVVIGANAGSAGSATNGDRANNTIVGTNAGTNMLANSDNNVLFGFQAGDLITTGTDNIIIGYDVDPTSATASNELNIGNAIYGNLSNGNIGIGKTNPGDRLTVLGGDIVLRESDDGNDAFNLSANGTTSTIEMFNDANSIVRISSQNVTDSYLRAGSFVFGDTSADASALVEIESTSKGFLPPRNTDPAGNISSPATGLIAYDSTDNQLQVYDGSNWVAFSGITPGVSDRIQDADNNTYVDVDTSDDGATNTISMVLSGTERLNVGTSGRIDNTFTSGGYNGSVILRNTTTPADGVGHHIEFRGSTSIEKGSIGYQWEDNGSDDTAAVWSTRLGGTVTEKMRLTSDGSLGIGTATPDDAFHLVSNIGELEFIIENTNATGGGLNSTLTLRNPEGSYSLRTDDDALSIRSATLGDAIATFDNAGRLGIGTPSPLQLLSVESASNTASIRVRSAADEHSSLNFITSGTGTIGGASGQGWHLFARGDSFATASEVEDLGLSFWDGTNFNRVFLIEHDTNNIGIGASAPDASSILQLTATDRGFLPPRVADPAGDITSPATGLIAYDSTDNQLQVYDGSNWVAFSGITPGVSDRIQDADNNTYIDVDASNDGTSNNIAFAINGSTRMQISNGGNLGIGTQGATTRLVVADTSSNTNDVKSVVRIRNNPTGSAATAGFGVGVDFEADNIVIASVDAVMTDVTATDEDGALSFKTMAAGAAPDEKMRLTSNGNLGIGTSAPEAELEVSNTGQAQIDIVSDSNASSTDTNALLRLWIDGPASSGARVGTFGYDQGEDVLKMNYGSIGSNHLTINSLGNVGIGTNTPNGLLQIAGASLSDSDRLISITEDGDTLFSVTARDGGSIAHGPSRDFSVCAIGSSNCLDIDNAGLEARDHRGIRIRSREDDAGASYGMAFYNDVVMPTGVPLLKIGIGDNTATAEYLRVDSTGGIGIGTGAENNASALLEISSATRGFLPPRIADPANDVTSPATGLIAYDSTDNELQVYDGSNWVTFSGGAASYVDRIQDADNDTYIDVDNSDDDTIRFTAAGINLFTMTGTGAVGKNMSSSDGRFYYDQPDDNTSTPTFRAGRLLSGSGTAFGNEVSAGSGGFAVGMGNGTSRQNTGARNFGIWMNAVEADITGDQVAAFIASTSENIALSTSNTFNVIGLNALINPATSSLTYLAPDASAALDVYATDQGFLPPRVADPANDISSPATGLIAYDSTDNELQVYDGSGWVTFSGGSAGALALDDLTDVEKDANNLFAGEVYGSALTNAHNNTSFGIGALDSLTDGSAGFGDGDDNTAFGRDALTNMQDGAQNVAVGSGALGGYTSGDHNIAIGWNALRFGNGGDNNTAIGKLAGANYINSGSSRNTFVGSEAGFGTPNAEDVTDNVAIGYRAGASLDTNAVDNVLMGSEAGDAITSGSRNVLLGRNAGGANQTMNDMIAIGYDAGALATSTSFGGPIFIGNYAGDAINGDTLGTIGIGYNALTGATSNNVTGTVVLGQAAMFDAGASLPAQGNTSIGDFSGGYFRSGNDNVFLGSRSGAAVVGGWNGANNVFLGQNVGAALTGGATDNNVMIGQGAGATLESGDNNILIGQGVDVSGTTSSNELNIGNVLYGNLSNGNIGIGTPTPADQLHLYDSSGRAKVVIEGADASQSTIDFITAGDAASELDGGTSTGWQFYTYNDGWADTSRDNDFGIAQATNGSFTDYIYLDSDTNNVGIFNTSPNASAVLDITSTDKGFLPPRVADPANDISSPATGLIAYDSTDNQLQVYDGSNWVSFSGGSGADADWQIDSVNNYVYNTTDSIGIGTATPFAELHVTGTLPTVRITGTGNDAEIIMGENDVGDPVSGVAIRYEGADNELNFYDNADLVNPVLTVQRSGNIGINKGNPAETLDVVGDATFSRFGNSLDITLLNAGGTASSPSAVSNGDDLPSISFAGYDGDDYGTEQEHIAIYGQVNGTVDTSNVPADLIFALDPLGDADETASAEKMRITSAGNVGIGIAAPAGSLHIFNSDTTNALTIEADTATDNAVVQFVNQNSANAASIGLETGQNSLVFNTQQASANYIFSTSGTERMRMTPDGDVGIGTNTPVNFGGSTASTVLHVRSNSTNGDAELVLDSGTNSLNANPLISFASGGTQYGYIASQRSGTGATDGGITFGTHNGTSLGERMRLDIDGRLGVGTASPNASALLDIRSTDKGFLPPRIADPAGDITSPATGLIAYDSTDNELQVYDGSNWVAFSGTGSIVPDDSLDWDKFTDTMTLDATTTIEMDTNTANLNFDSNTLVIDSAENAVAIGTTTIPLNANFVVNLAASERAVFGTLNLGNSGNFYSSGTNLTMQGGGSGTSRSSIILPNSSSSPIELNASTLGTQNVEVDLRSNGGYFSVSNGAMGVGTTSPDASSILELSSTSQGFLPPRINDPANDISTPATGLIAYDSTDNELQVYDGSNWVTFSGGSAAAISIDDLTDAIHNTTTTFNLFLGDGVGTLATGGLNVGVGQDALASLTSGTNNVAVGVGALLAGETTTNNVGFGSNAGRNWTGSNNVAVGYLAGQGGSGTVSAENSVFIGNQAGTAITSGNQNIMIGSQAGQSLTTTGDNVIMGYRAGNGTTTSYRSVIVGAFAGENAGYQNTFIGERAGRDATSSGVNNTFVGRAAGQNFESGSGNILIGNQSESAIFTSGSNNILIGDTLDTSAATASNELNIGNTIFGNLTNAASDGTGAARVGINNTAPTAALEIDYAGTSSDDASPDIARLVLRNTGTQGGAAIQMFEVNSQQGFEFENYSATGGLANYLSMKTYPASATPIEFLRVQRDNAEVQFRNLTVGGDASYVSQLRLMENVDGSEDGMIFEYDGVNNIFHMRSGTGGTYPEILTIGRADRTVGIGTAGVAANASAQLEIASTTRGFLPPRIADPANDITSPATGLIAYDSTDNQLQVYDGSSWVAFSGGSAASIAINDLTDASTTASSMYVGTGSAPSATGVQNTVLGIDTFVNATAGNNNTFIGWQAGGNAAMTDGQMDDNTALGFRAGYNLSSGASGNIFIGERAGSNETSGDNNIIIGNNISTSGFDAQNELNIGNVIYGNTSNGRVAIGGTVDSSNILDVTGITNINSIYFQNSGGTVNSNGTDFRLIGGGVQTTRGHMVLPNGTTSPIEINAGSTATQNVEVDLRGNGGAFIVDNGNAGIGGAPAAGVDFQVTNNQNAATIIDAINSDTGASAISIVSATSDVGSVGLRAFGSGVGGGFTSVYSDDPGGLVLENEASGGHVSIATGATSAERLRVDENGNVGIGETSPSAPLHVTSNNPDFFLDFSTSPTTWADIVIADQGVQKAALSYHRTVGRFVIDSDRAGTGGYLLFEGDRSEFNHDVHVGSNTAPDASAVLQATSTTKGFLPPRNTDPAANISSPATGLVAYDSTDNELQVYDGSSWVAMNSSGGSSLWTAGTGDDIYYNPTTPQVGIGNTSPDVALDVTGDIEYSGTLTDVSDRRLKTDIQKLDTAEMIERLAQIDTYSFKMKDDEAGRTEYGVMAQDIEKLFPELVKTAEDEMGTKSVNYMGLIAPMIEVSKALKEENDSLKSEMAEMKSQQAEILAALSDMKEDVAGIKLHTDYGYQKAAYTSWPMMLMMMIFGGGFVFFMSRLRRQS